MAKSIRYKIGDIFLVPLERDLNGVGRILSSSQATVLLELYRMKPVTKAEEFNFEEAIQEKALIMSWCYDDAHRKGGWKIIGNQPVKGEIEMPYFWTQDAGNLKYYIRKGTMDSFRTIGERIEIAKEEIHNYDPYGIGNEISERKRYIKKLVLAGLLHLGE
ncbi:immunity 26/phosphotriesterase HocA family protein [Paenibacillus sp. HB172176]|uniref:immunity 26/phosphotriesterase HocA family protein n=1 Tax=Paenibacillus sp. HB172176 TaxID=2493690 RepID=UPI0014396B81|nr:immunity 26/phosphotriesterase HocA family protein [Paenibacillus sp. HB172176]